MIWVGCGKNQRASGCAPDGVLQLLPGFASDVDRPTGAAMRGFASVPRFHLKHPTPLDSFGDPRMESFDFRNVSATQDSATQVSATQVSATQVSATQVSATQVSVTQGSATQVSATQVSALSTLFRAQPISVFFDNFFELFCGHICLFFCG
jgi:hypothetical protein